MISPITTHDFYYTPYAYPKIKGSVTYITHAMPQAFLQHPAYTLHKNRSLWMGYKGRLGLVIGPVYTTKRDVKNNIIYTFDNDCLVYWTKPGALKIERKHFIKFQVMLEPIELAGNTRVELDGETALLHKIGE